MATTATSAPLPSSSHTTSQSTSSTTRSNLRDRAAKYRGASVEDLDPPPALSVSPQSSIHAALLRAYEHDYTHLTVVSNSTRALLGYISMPKLRELLQKGTVKEEDPVENAMMRFRRKGRKYEVITMETPLEVLEGFFEGEALVEDEDGNGNGGKEKDEKIPPQGKQDFAIVTDWGRRFVLGVVTRWDLDEFVRRRPA